VRPNDAIKGYIPRNRGRKANMNEINP
jgi:hypothetical protein